jgi:serine/threonine-protein kinase
MMELCKLLTYLHSLQPPLIHRDVKPANLMLRTRDRQPVLLDFGAVKEIGTPLATRIGAEGYSAPEQNRGKPTPQSDIYAIGPTIIFLLTGNSPIKYVRHRGGKFVFDVSKVPTIAPPLQKIIAKCSEPNLRDRFASVEQVAQALSHCLNQLQN